MTMHDDLRDRLSRFGDAVDPGAPPLDEIRIRGRRRRHVGRMAGALAGLVIAAGVAFPLHALLRAWVAPSSTSKPGGGSSEVTATWDPSQNVMRTAPCSPSLDPPTYHLVVGISLRDAPDPVGTCRDIWRTGHAVDDPAVVFISVSPHDDQPGDEVTPSPVGEVPALSLCAGIDPGRAAIVPSSGDDGCSGNGMVPMPTGYRDVLDRFAAALREVTQVLPSDGRTCATGADAAGAWRDALDAHGFDTWTVDAEGFDAASAEEPCASFSIDERAMTVRIVNDASS